MPAFTARTLPGLPILFPAERIAALDAQLDACADRPVASLGLSEMSIVVRSGTDTEFPDVQGAAEILNTPGGRVFITDKDNALLDQVTAASGIVPRQIAEFDTINYNRSDQRLKTRVVMYPDDATLDACLPPIIPDTSLR